MIADIGVVIVAAGSGSRVGGSELKQFRWVAGKPMLLHSVQKFQAREYWIVDLDNQLIEVWQLIKGRFIRDDIYGIGETFRSAVLSDFEIIVNDIFNG